MRMKKLAPFLIVAVAATASCSAARRAPAGQLLTASQSYEVVQIAIERYVTSPSADPQVKKILQEVDNEAFMALTDAYLVVQANPKADITYYQDILDLALTKAQRIIADAEAR